MTATTGYADVNGIKLYYEVTGEGHPLVLIHSMLMNHKMWDDQVEAFSKKYKVIRYDQRGYGKSELKSPVNNVSDLAELLKVLGIEKTYVLGLSMGGEIALEFALEYPDKVDGLVLVGSGLPGYPYSEDPTGWWNEFIGYVKAKDFSKAIDVFIKTWVDGPEKRADDKVRQRARAIMSEYTFGHYLDDSLQWWEADTPASERIKDMKIPTLLIVGEDDQLETLEVADVLEKDIESSAELVEIPDAAHIVNLQQPAAFNRAVLDFLGTL